MYFIPYLLGYRRFVITSNVLLVSDNDSNKIFKDFILLHTH